MRPFDRSAFLADVLQGREGAAGVRHLATHAWDDGLVDLPCSDGLTRMSAHPQLLRTKFKPGRKLTATYLLSPDDPTVEPVHAVVSFTVASQGSSTTLLVEPTDSAMPQLRSLADAAHVALLVGLLTGRTVVPSPADHVRTVRYRPAQRHVLLATLAGIGDGIYVKTDREHSGARAVRVAKVIDEAFDRSGSPATTVKPLGWFEDDAAALWWRAPGVPLSRLVAEGAPGLPSVLSRVGRALRVLHEVPGAEAARVGPWPAERQVRFEARAALRAATHLRALLPEIAATYSSLLSRVVDVLDGMPADEPVLAHGDFKSDNILVHRGRPRILDLDRAAKAEPALDLGKLMADLTWWCAEPVLSKHLDALRAGYGTCDGLRWARAELWAVLYELKIVARRCALQDPDWEQQVRRRMAAASAALVVAGGAR